MIAVLNPILIAQAEASAPDPVFALIEEHRAAHAVWAPLSEAWNGLLLTDQAYAAAEEAGREPGDRVRAAVAALTKARPASLAGVLALAEYLPGAIRQVAIDEESDGERALHSIAEALRSLLPLTGPSGDLVAMVERWQALGRQLDAEPDDGGAFGRLSAQHNDLQFAIYRYPAASMADLAAKVPVFRDEMGVIANASPTCDPADTLTGGAWLGLFRDLEHLNGAHAAPGQPETPDPVLAAIAASRAAEAEMKAFQKTADTPTTPEWRVREDVLCAAQVDAQGVVWRTVPTTRAGRRALIDYARFMVEVFTDADGCLDNPEGMLTQILDAMAAAVDAERPETAVPPLDANGRGGSR